MNKVTVYSNGYIYQVPPMDLCYFIVLLIWNFQVTDVTLWLEGGRCINHTPRGREKSHIDNSGDLDRFYPLPFLSTFFLPVSEIAIFVWQVKRIKSDPGDLANNEQPLSQLDWPVSPTMYQISYTNVSWIRTTFN